MNYLSSYTYPALGVVSVVDPHMRIARAQVDGKGARVPYVSGMHPNMKMRLDFGINMRGGVVSKSSGFRDLVVR